MSLTDTDAVADTAPAQDHAPPLSRQVADRRTKRDRKSQ